MFCLIQTFQSSTNICLHNAQNWGKISVSSDVNQTPNNSPTFYCITRRWQMTDYSKYKLNLISHTLAKVNKILHKYCATYMNFLVQYQTIRVEFWLFQHLINNFKLDMTPALYGKICRMKSKGKSKENRETYKLNSYFNCKYS